MIDLSAANLRKLVWHRAIELLECPSLEEEMLLDLAQDLYGDDARYRPLPKETRDAFFRELDGVIATIRKTYLRKTFAASKRARKTP